MKKFRITLLLGITCAASFTTPVIARPLNHDYHYYCSHLSGCQQNQITGDPTTVTLAHSVTSRFYISCNSLLMPRADIDYHAGVSLVSESDSTLGVYEYSFFNWDVTGNQDVTVNDIRC